MDEPVNPYASPEADITPVPLSEAMLTDLPGLRTTGIGLSLVYYGIIILLLTLIGTVPAGFLVASIPAIGFLVLAAGVVVLAASLMMFVGQVLCLAVPSQTGANVYIIVAVVMQIASFVQSFLPVIQQFAPRVRFSQPITLLLNSLGVISLIFFVLFMRRLSLFLGRNNLARRARNLLIFSAILVPVGVAAFLANNSRDSSFFVFGVVLILDALICFVMYADLINALRKVLLRKPRRDI
jgi:hypothetical protein